MAAEYELEHLLLEGHCYDITTGQPPRGLQFTLGTSTNPVVVDTIVMANLVSYYLANQIEYFLKQIWKYSTGYSSDRCFRALPTYFLGSRYPALCFIYMQEMAILLFTDHLSQFKLEASLKYLT